MKSEKGQSPLIFVLAVLGIIFVLWLVLTRV